MSFFGGLLAGGLLGAYWTRPGGWLSGIYGGTRPMPYSYYYGPTYYPQAQYRYLPQYGYPVQYYGYRQLPYGYYY